MEEETEKGKENRRGTGSKPTKKLKWHLCLWIQTIFIFCTGTKANHNTLSLMQACVNISKVV